MNTITPNDAAEAIIANMRMQFDVTALVADARTKLGVTARPVGDDVEVNITGAEAIVVNNLLAKAEELDKIAKAATSERELIKQTIVEYIPDDVEVLKVNGAEVFTYKTQTARVLDQAAVKARFPDIPGNEFAWKDQVTRPRRFR